MCLGDKMKLYLDVIFFLNFGFDFILLLSVSLLLRRNVKLRRIALGAFVGGSSIFALFIPFSSFTLFLFKFLISVIMLLVTFSYRNKKYFFRNLFYLYTASILLGGFLYFLNVQFSYGQEGLIFYHKGLSVNVIFLVLFSPIILYAYVKQGIHLKQTYSNYYKVKLYLGETMLEKTAFLDTGNCLVDPYFGRPIILMNEKEWKDDTNSILVPIYTACETSMLKCIKLDKLEIIGHGEKKNVLLGLTKQPLVMEGIDVLLQKQLLEG